MGALGKLFGVLFGRILNFFGVYLSGKLVLFTAAVTAFIVMLGGLTVLFNTLLNSISMITPAEFQFALGVIPQNIPVCISVIITARIALWMFSVKWTIVKIKMNG